MFLWWLTLVFVSYPRNDFFGTLANISYLNCCDWALINLFPLQTLIVIKICYFKCNFIYIGMDLDKKNTCYGRPNTPMFASSQISYHLLNGHCSEIFLSQRSKTTSQTQLLFIMVFPYSPALISLFNCPSIVTTLFLWSTKKSWVIYTKTPS